MKRTGIAMLMLTSLLTMTSSCSSALSLSGELDGEVVPAGFSGAMASVNLNGQDISFGVWSTFSDTCGLAGQLMDGLNDVQQDASGTDDTIEEFFDRVPGDFWLMTTFFGGLDGTALDDEVDFDDDSISAAGFLCHFTDGPDLSGQSKTSCGFVDGEQTDATLTLHDDSSLSFAGELNLIQQERNSGRQVVIGSVSGSGVAPVCPAFDEAMTGFLNDCFQPQNSTGPGCQTAVSAYVNSHTIRR